MIMDAPRRTYIVGIILLLAASCLWSLNGALIKLTFKSGQGPSAVAIAFYRSLFAGLFLLPLARGKFHTLCVTKEGGRQLDNSRGLFQCLMSLRPAAILCVLFFTAMTACFVLANTKTGAANVIVLQYTSTFWIFGLSPWLLHEKPRAGDLWLLGVAMVGIGIIFAGSANTDLLGLTIALGSGLFFGLLSLMIRQMRDSDSGAVSVLNNLGSAVLLIPIVLLFGGFELSTRSLVLLMIMGVVQFGLPYYLYTLGLVRVAAYQAALITLLEVVLNPVWTFVAVGEKPPLPTVIGGTVILFALLGFFLLARRRSGSGISEA
jgi:drug/metabolite transporter (DMT)-like permease